MRLAAASQASPDMSGGNGLPPEAGTEEIDAFVGSRLRSRRMEVGLSQAALGRHLGVTFSQVQKYEKGTNRIGAGRLFSIAALLGVPVQYFFDGLDQLGPDAAGSKDAAVAGDAARLQQAFKKISNPLTRQALISLASSMMDEG